MVYVRFNEAAGIHRRKQLEHMVPVELASPSFNEAAGIHRRKRRPGGLAATSHAASMRPPEFTGGNRVSPGCWEMTMPYSASMRPPEFTGGNLDHGRIRTELRPIAKARFNEAAGIHRRKRVEPGRADRRYVGGLRFNEAAGIHRRKLRPAGRARSPSAAASMRPPEFTGGNFTGPRPPQAGAWLGERHRAASMRPPEFTGGNLQPLAGAASQLIASMRPPEFTGGNDVRPDASR